MIKAEIRHQENFPKQIAVFDVPIEENSSVTPSFSNKIIDTLETQIGRGYEILGHKLSNMGTQLEQNKDTLTEKATYFYKNSLANRTGTAYENFQYGYGKIGDGLSSILNWLGENVIRMGHITSTMIRTSFHTIGDIVGDTVDNIEYLVGTGLIKSGGKVHIDAIDLQRTSHNDSENFRYKIQQSAPKFKQSLNQLIDKLAQRIHTVGTDTEIAGEVIEHHHFLDTIKKAYYNLK
ncbi:unnamed protein product [Adineta steineri]|uniref:Uncharacterized protein n=1 Tax=Adineta steineri TaxID=433720 RepID=A0A818SRA7_9BILA|nr:unnamed protein product [Adineta steineri]CAF3672570.1 unnamed protein product [Adineta steineri]